MKGSHLLTIAVVLLAGYYLGTKYPGFLGSIPGKLGL